MDQNIEERIRAIAKEKLLFIGLGNEYMGDDAAGMFLARLLAQGGAHVLEAGKDLMGAMYIIGDMEAEHAVFLDAAGMGLEPGDARILDELEMIGRCISTHENNFPLAMHYMKCIKPDIKVMFIGIQFNTLEMNETPKLSPEVGKAVESLAKAMLAAMSAGPNTG